MQDGCLGIGAPLGNSLENLEDLSETLGWLLLYYALGCRENAPRLSRISRYGIFFTI